VIQRYNFRKWTDIIETAKAIGLNSISFLPADVSSSAFNRELLWTEDRQQEIRLLETDLIDLKKVIDEILERFSEEFRNHFISESPEKLQKIYSYYAAFYGHNEFPYKKCNAPWVSTVIEADGNVRPCFFHPVYDNINSGNLDSIINSSEAIRFRKNLNVETNPTCVKCVCYLNLKPATKI
jgi:sulfatase maturation enzyme AslB (radical SAM superfamily)